MKKAISLIAVAAAATAVFAFSGCSAVFPFNPTGKWVLTDNILSENGTEKEHITQKDMAYKDLSYIFDKNGSGHIDVNGTRIYNFKYECGDKSVTLTIDNTPVDPKLNVGEQNKITTVEFKLESDSDIVGSKMIRTDETDFRDTEGNEHHLQEQFIITKTL